MAVVFLVSSTVAWTRWLKLRTRRYVLRQGAFHGARLWLITSCRAFGERTNSTQDCSGAAVRNSRATGSCARVALISPPAAQRTVDDLTTAPQDLPPGLAAQTAAVAAADERAKQTALVSRPVRFAISSTLQTVWRIAVRVHAPACSNEVAQLLALIAGILLASSDVHVTGVRFEFRLCVLANCLTRDCRVLLSLTPAQRSPAFVSTTCRSGSSPSPCGAPRSPRLWLSALMRDSR
jgi:hypothetical protein